jgi:hypothetical protein
VGVGFSMVLAKSGTAAIGSPPALSRMSGIPSSDQEADGLNSTHSGLPSFFGNLPDVSNINRLQFSKDTTETR